MHRLLMSALVLMLATPAAAAPPIFGRWLVEDGRAVIEIAPCGAEACGRLVWIDNPRDSNGNPRRDVNNPDPAARARPLCGLPLITGLAPADDGSWQGGRIYSARDGRTYGFQVTPAGDGQLAARGYVGLSLLGKSQTWTHEGGRRGTCTTLGGAGSDR